MPYSMGQILSSSLAVLARIRHCEPEIPSQPVLWLMLTITSFQQVEHQPCRGLLFLLVVSWARKVRLFVCLFFQSPFTPENLVSLPSRVSQLILPAQAESGAYSLARYPPSRFPRLRLHSPSIPPDAIGPVQSLSGDAFASRWRSPPRVRRHRVSYF